MTIISTQMEKHRIATIQTQRRLQQIREGYILYNPRRITSTRKPVPTGTNTQSTYDNSVTT